MFNRRYPSVESAMCDWGFSTVPIQIVHTEAIAKPVAEESTN